MEEDETTREIEEAILPSNIASLSNMPPVLNGLFVLRPPTPRPDSGPLSNFTLRSISLWTNPIVIAPYPQGCSPWSSCEKRNSVPSICPGNHPSPSHSHLFPEGSFRKWKFSLVPSSKTYTLNSNSWTNRIFLTAQTSCSFEKESSTVFLRQHPPTFSTCSHPHLLMTCLFGTAKRKSNTMGVKSSSFCQYGQCPKRSHTQSLVIVSRLNKKETVLLPQILYKIAQWVGIQLNNVNINFGHLTSCYQKRIWDFPDFSLVISMHCSYQLLTILRLNICSNPKYWNVWYTSRRICGLLW